MLTMRQTSDTTHDSDGNPWHVEEYTVLDEHGTVVCVIQRTPHDVVVFDATGAGVGPVADVHPVRGAAYGTGAVTRWPFRK